MNSRAELVRDQMTASLPSRRIPIILKCLATRRHLGKKVKIVVKLNLFPVEYFCDEIPLCSTLEILRNVHFIFILDERTSKTNNEYIKDLTRRFNEVEQSVKCGLKAHADELTDVPCVLMSLLTHTQPDPYDITDVDTELHHGLQSECPFRAASESSGDAFGSEFDETGYRTSLSCLTQQIRDYVKYTEFPIHYTCDLEDRKSVLMTTMKMVQLYFVKDLRLCTEQPSVHFRHSCLPCCVQ